MVMQRGQCMMMWVRAMADDVKMPKHGDVGKAKVS